MLVSYLLLFLSVSIDTLKNIYYNYFGKNELQDPKDALLFNVVSCLGSVVFFLVVGAPFHVSQYSFFLAILFAIVTVGAQYLSLLAMSLGPMSFSVLFTYLSMLIPTLFGIVCYSQTISMTQVVGLILMIITFVLSLEFKGSNKISIKWLLTALGSFVAWGLVGILQQLHQNSMYKDELDGFLLWTFVFSTLIFVLLLLLRNKSDKQPSSMFETRSILNRATLFTLLIGVVIGAVNKINLYLSGRMPSIIFFPIVNGGVIILSGLAAILFFKEKLSQKQFVGLIAGLLATCLLGI